MYIRDLYAVIALDESQYLVALRIRGAPVRRRRDNCQFATLPFVVVIHLGHGYIEFPSQSRFETG
jgi:hypothetical protein